MRRLLNLNSHNHNQHDRRPRFSLAVQTTRAPTCKRSYLAQLSRSGLSLHVGFSATLGYFWWVRNNFRNMARGEWWSIHLEACSAAAGRSAAIAHNTDSRDKIHALVGLRREERRQHLRKRQIRRSSDMRSKAVEPFQVMHVDTMGWCGMGAPRRPIRCPVGRICNCQRAVPGTSCYLPSAASVLPGAATTLIICSDQAACSLCSRSSVVVTSEARSAVSENISLIRDNRVAIAP